MRRGLLVGLLAVCGLLLVLAEPAIAQTSDVGKNVGREVKTWATALMLGVAGLVAIPLFIKREVSQALVLALLVVIVGGFVFAQDAVRVVISGLWRSVSG